MPAFTLRLEDDLSKKLDQACQKYGYSKNGLIKSLIRDFLEGKSSPTQSQPLFQDLVGVVSLGGDSLKDTENFFE